MYPRLLASALLLVALAACEVPPSAAQRPGVYYIPASKQAEVQYRMLDSINAVREAAGVGPVHLDAQLTSASATHARDISVQNRAWHFGSDGSSPIDRVARTGYGGRLLGETVSLTYETETETLAAWLERPDTKQVILDPRATAIGFAWFQEPTGRLWWVLDVAS